MTKHSLSNKRWNERHPDYNKEYQKAHCKFYHMNMSRSRKYVNRYALTHHECEICHCKATEIHHKIPLPNDRLVDFGDPILTEANLIAVCPACHDKLHVEMRK